MRNETKSSEAVGFRFVFVQARKERFTVQIAGGNAMQAAARAAAAAAVVAAVAARSSTQRTIPGLEKGKHKQQGDNIRLSTDTMKDGRKVVAFRLRPAFFLFIFAVRPRKEVA